MILSILSLYDICSLCMSVKVPKVHTPHRIWVSNDQLQIKQNSYNKYSVKNHITYGRWFAAYVMPNAILR